MADIEELSLNKFCFTNESERDKLKNITIFYGNFHQSEDRFAVKGTDYEIFRRDTITIMGSVGNPLRALTKKCLSERTVRRIKSYAPDVILYEFLGTEKLIDNAQPNPMGLFVLKFERALGCMATEDSKASDKGCDDEGKKKK